MTGGLADNRQHAQMEELMFQRTKLKKKMLGNIKFIGELFNLTMISSKIILVQVGHNLYFRSAPNLTSYEAK